MLLFVMLPWKPRQGGKVSYPCLGKQINRERLVFILVKVFKERKNYFDCSTNINKTKTAALNKYKTVTCVSVD